MLRKVIEKSGMKWKAGYWQYRSVEDGTSNDWSGMKGNGQAVKERRVADRIG